MLFIATVSRRSELEYPRLWYRRSCGQPRYARRFWTILQSSNFSAKSLTADGTPTWWTTVPFRALHPRSTINCWRPDRQHRRQAWTETGSRADPIFLRGESPAIATKKDRKRPCRGGW